MGKAIMLQGTGSDVGKSVLAAALCRILSQDGYRVAPFKAQNMALNSGVADDGREIGRAQLVQAEAAQTPAVADMNPVLLKPISDTDCQVVLMGHAIGNFSASHYMELKQRLSCGVKESLARLKAAYDVVVIEGAGSPAEVNLREHDIVNMPVARWANAPVLLVADIDRGGLFAYVHGTLKLLLPWERQLIRGIIVNKFRGDRRRFSEGEALLSELSGLPVLGVVPFDATLDIPEEDAVPAAHFSEQGDKGDVVVGVVYLPHISNFTDFDALRREPGIVVRYLRPNSSWDCDLLILPGSKNTIGDLMALRQQGLDERIVELWRRKVPIFGICGGYQMLGQSIVDAVGVESKYSRTDGLGLLPITTEFVEEKQVQRVQGRIAGPHNGLFAGCSGLDVSGYELHMGRSLGPKGRPLLRLDTGEEDGAVTDDGLVAGTYLHGFFDQPQLRKAFLQNVQAIGPRPLAPDGMNHRDPGDPFDAWADHVRSSLDLQQVYSILGE